MSAHGTVVVTGPAFDHYYDYGSSTRLSEQDLG